MVIADAKENRFCINFRSLKMVVHRKGSTSVIFKFTDGVEEHINMGDTESARRLFQDVVARGEFLSL